MYVWYEGDDVLALCETKMKGNREVAFGEVTGRVSGVERGRRERVWHYC